MFRTDRNDVLSALLILLLFLFPNTTSTDVKLSETALGNMTEKYEGKIEK